jgi:hypothetical protein
MLILDVANLTDEELAAEKEGIIAEQDKRSIMAQAPVMIAQLNQDYLGAEGVVEGEPWRQPTGSHDAYPLDWVVTHGDKTWQSTVAGNVWEPGVSGWRELVEEGGAPAAWVQPTGAHDAYSVGARVTHVEKVWVSDVDDNVWEPGVYGWTEEIPE